MVKVIGSISDTPESFPDVKDSIYWDMTFVLDDEGIEDCEYSIDTTRYKEDVNKWFKKWFDEWNKSVA